MEQTKALNVLEPFLALTKSASSPRAAADLVTRATSHPSTFVFSELLLAPQIQALQQSPEYVSHIYLLQIFSYGTYEDYKTTPNLPKLNPAQTQKLRQLSLLTLARDPKNLTYDYLTSALELESTRALEDLVISAIYAGLLSGTLDPYNQRVAISSVSPLRDIAPNSIPTMIKTLHDWSSRCTATLADLEAELAKTKQEALDRHVNKLKWDEWFEGLMSEQGSTGGKGFGGGSGGKRGSPMMGGDMDIDEEDSMPLQRGRGNKVPKKRGFGGH